MSLISLSVSQCLETDLIDSGFSSAEKAFACLISIRKGQEGFEIWGKLAQSF